MKTKIALLMLAGLLSPLCADQVISDDLIVQGSECVGIDCVNNYNFGFDTFMLSENNLRIFFNDTSNSGSFPSNDWRITINDSNNGGASYFSIDDATANRSVFKVMAGAPANSLFVSNSGRVGIGTSTPAVNLQVTNGNTPALRLEQDQSAGWTAQSWDVAGNETNFFVRDVTHGSKLPFKIIPGAPTNSLYVNSSGNIGLGTASPDASLHIKRADGTAKIHLQEASGTTAVREMLNLTNNGGSYITMTNSNIGKSWYFTYQNSDGNFNITNDDTGGPAMLLTKTGDMTIAGTLTTSGTTCGGGGCDLVFDKSFKLPSIEEHAQEMWKEKYLPAVGPTAENKPFNLSEKTGRMLNELEKAHIYIDQLNNKIKDNEGTIAALQSKLDEMNSKFDSLQTQLSSLERK